MTGSSHEVIFFRGRNKQKNLPEVAIKMGRLKVLLSIFALKKIHVNMSSSVKDYKIYF